MRIIDLETNKTVDNILIMLTPEEASELSSKIKHIDVSKGAHIHVDDLDYRREITVAIYTEENLSFFSDTVRAVLKAN